MREEQKKEKTWISFRVKPEEYREIHRLFKQSACRKLSDYARKVLLQKPVVVTYRNQSANDFLRVAGALAKELNSVGNNFNQAVKKLHTLRGEQEFREWYTGWNLSRQILVNKVDEVRKVLGKIYEDGRQDRNTADAPAATEL